MENYSPPLKYNSKAHQVKKPMNAFFRYQGTNKRYKAAMKDEIIRQAGTTKGTIVSKVAGEMWRNEPKEIRDYFNKQSADAVNEHRRKYPDFIWPSKNSKARKEKLRRTDGHIMEPFGIISAEELAAVERMNNGNDSDEVSNADTNVLPPLYPSDRRSSSHSGGSPHLQHGILQSNLPPMQNRPNLHRLPPMQSNGRISPPNSHSSKENSLPPMQRGYSIDHTMPMMNPPILPRVHQHPPQGYGYPNQEPWNM
ncbi:hypothetical protein HDV06_004677 [Boothiomyces sp. JEL0866]|nr:hypothetical protein HDV06_004677 [Boothiomyces sp. JEL0866]